MPVPSLDFMFGRVKNPKHHLEAGPARISESVFISDCAALGALQFPQQTTFSYGDRHCQAPRTLSRRCCDAMD
jgi:hypothetical protein